MIRQQIIGISRNAEYLAVGTGLDWKDLQFGRAHKHNGDIVNVLVRNGLNQLVTVALNENGYEFFARAGLRRFGLIRGFTYPEPNSRNRC